MQLEATLTAHKATLGTTIVASGMPTSRTPLRGMPGINPSYRQSAFFGLIREESEELRKRPTMHAAFGWGMTFCPHALANIREVFENERAPRSRRLGKLFRQEVITIPAKPRLFPAQVSQVPFGALGATGLQTTLEPEVAPLSRFPSFLTKKRIGRCDRRMCQTKVNANDFIGLWHGGSFQRDHDMQPPPSIVVLDEVCRVGREANILLTIARDSKRHRHSSFYRRKTYGSVVPGQGIGMQVVTRWTGCRVRTRDRACSFLKGKGRLEGFSGLNPCLNDQVRYQPRTGSFLGIVRGVVQLYAVPLGMCPAIGADIIECLGKQVRRVRERLCLDRSRFECKSYSSLHTIILPYAMRFNNFHQRKDRGETAVLLTQDVHSSAS